MTGTEETPRERRMAAWHAAGRTLGPAPQRIGERLARLTGQLGDGLEADDVFPTPAGMVPSTPTA